MKFLYFFIVFLWFSITVKSQSIDLTTENFDSKISKGLAFVMFYAPWCGHCQHLKPTWDELSQKKRDVVIGKVNCDVETSLASKYNIGGFPSLLLFYDGELITEYGKGRKLNDFIKFIDDIKTPKKNENGKVEVLTDENFDLETTVINSPMIVKFYSPGCGHCIQLAPTWEKLAEKLRNTNVRVGKINCLENPTVCTRYIIQGYPTIKFITESHVIEYKKERSLDNLLEFAKSGWKLENHEPKPAYNASHIDWKLIALVVGIFLVLFCVCVCLLVWMTNDLSSNDDSTIDPFAKEKPVLKGEKIKVDSSEYLKGKTEKQD